jgi:hypothetical protein
MASALLMPRLAAWLLDRGADANAQAEDGTTPLDMAGQRCDAAEKVEKTDGIVGLLRDRGAELTARSAVILGDENVLRSRHQEEDLLTPRDDRAGCSGSRWIATGLRF